MAVLLITEQVREEIQAAVLRARARTIPWEQLKPYTIVGDKDKVVLGDRPKGFERIESERVLIPNGFRAAISFEEQPAGICRHLSVSVENPTRMPSTDAVRMVAAEFGFKLESGKVWTEEFAPGHYAVNVIEIAERKE